MDGNKIGRSTTSGVITEFPLPTTDSRPAGITSGPDGSLWFTEENGNKIRRIDPNSQVITEFPLPTTDSRPAGITSGLGDKLWFTESNANQIGQIATG